MREDMARVIVERPRIIPRSCRKGRFPDLENLPACEGMRRAHRGERKHLNENLAPLRRYLTSQVGRPWAKVYSEIAAHLRVDSAAHANVSWRWLSPIKQRVRARREKPARLDRAS